MTVEQWLERAAALHRQGRLDEAELLYRRVLDVVPDHPDALHLLGVAALQRGDAARACRWIAQAAARLPEVAAVFHNWAEAARLSGDAVTAVQAARRAVALAPQWADAHNHLGLALQAAGQTAEAEAAFRRAVELQPEAALAWNNLGALLRQQGRSEEALAAFRRAVEADPQLPLALSNLGQALLDHGEPDAAEPYLQQAVRLAPQFAEAWSNLGNLLRQRDQLDEAVACYRRALELRPDIAMVHGNLGQVLQQQGHLDAAIACYERAAQLDPASPRFETFWASALAEKEDFAAAAEHYRRALALQANYPEALHGLGTVLLEQGKWSEAIAHFDAALQQRPDFAEAYVSRAGAYAELGELERAEADYRTALQHDPEHAGALGVLAIQLRERLPQEDVARMEALLQREHLSEWRRAMLHHGLAHVYDGRGDYARAATHAAAGNALRRRIWERQGKAYRRDEHAQFVDFLIRFFTPDYFARVRGWGLETSLPVFVFGLPRSGTTLVEQVLASHPQVHGAGELLVTKQVFDRLPEWLQREAAAPLCLPELRRDVVQRAAKEHLAVLRGLHPTAARIVDKMPDNYLWLGWLATLFPRARLIYVRRNLGDVALSCWMTNFKQVRWACDWEDIAARIREHLRLMAHWQRVLPTEMLTVDYEELVADVEGTARRMLAYCGLEWDAACLRFYENRRPVRTASVTQVRQPVYRRAVGRWRHYQPFMGPLLQLLNLQQDTSEATHPDRLLPESLK